MQESAADLSHSGWINSMVAGESEIPTRSLDGLRKYAGGGEWRAESVCQYYDLAP